MILFTFNYVFLFGREDVLSYATTYPCLVKIQYTLLLFLLNYQRLFRWPLEGACSVMLLFFFILVVFSIACKTTVQLCTIMTVGPYIIFVPILPIMIMILPIMNAGACRPRIINPRNSSANQMVLEVNKIIVSVWDDWK